MDPLLALAKMFADDRTDHPGHRALPCAPVRPSRPRRQLLARPTTGARRVLGTAAWPVARVLRSASR